MEPVGLFGVAGCNSFLHGLLGPVGIADIDVDLRCEGRRFGTAQAERMLVMKIVLVGDSIRGCYQPLVVDKVGERAEVWGPPENCRHSLVHRESLTAWAIDTQPDVYHFNCGIHDLVVLDSEPRFTIDGYVRNLRLIVQRLKAECRARLIWATTTPMLVPRDGVTCMDDSTLDPDVVRYNEAALEIMGAAGLEVNDLCQTVIGAGVLECLSEDKVHMTQRGNDVLSDAVVRFILG